MCSRKINSSHLIESYILICIHLIDTAISSYSVQLLSCVWLFETSTVCMDCSTPGLPVPPPTPRAYSNSYPSSRWCHPTISSSVVPFSSCLQSFPVSGSFQMSQFFTSSGQSIGASASASVLPMNIQDWFPLGWTRIFLQSKGLSRVFSSTTIQKHQFFITQPSLWSNSHISMIVLANSLNTSNEKQRLAEKKK